MSNSERAVVAISEDRQWLVVLHDKGRWALYKWWDEDGWEGWTWSKESWSLPQDTGQDAHEVLMTFLEGRS